MSFKIMLIIILYNETMSTTNYNKPILTPEWNALLNALQSIDLGRMGPTNSQKRTQEQNEYIKALCSRNSKKNPNNYLYQIENALSTIIKTGNATAAADDKTTTIRNYIIQNNLHISDHDRKKILYLQAWVCHKDRPVDNGHTPESIVYLVQMLHLYEHNEQQIFLKNLIEVIKVIKPEDQCISLLQRIYNENKILLSKKDIKNLLSILKKEKITTFRELIIYADLTIENHIKHGKEDNQTDLNKLSLIANKLVQDTFQRRHAYPEEFLLATKIRLTINQQRLNPKEIFSQRLTPLLEEAKCCFERNRHICSAELITDILKILFIVPAVIEVFRKRSCKLMFFKSRSPTLIATTEELKKSIIQIKAK